MSERTFSDDVPGGLPSHVEMVVVPRTVDLGDGFGVRRALPSLQRRMVGPFVFFDEFGPSHFDRGRGLDVRPHPHIGLATISYLFDGEIMHRDSLGTVQSIRAGEVNWMTAGRGIAHSERTPAALRQSESRLSGVQIWVALPRSHEEIDPGFVHYEVEALPEMDSGGARLRLVVGTLNGAHSPVQTHSEMFYADVLLKPGARLELRAEHEERAAYVIEGTVTVSNGGGDFAAGRLMVFKPGVPIVLKASASAVHLLLLGGEPMDGPRHLWWNFVSSSRERIEQAKADWKEGRFGAVPDEFEFIPLPEDVPEPIRP